MSLKNINDHSYLDATQMEAWTIGALLNDPEKIVSENEEIGLRAKHFGCELHAQAWGFLYGRALRGESIEPRELFTHCEKDLQAFGGAKEGVQQFGIWQIDTPSTHHFKEHAGRVMEKSAKRDILQKLKEGSEKLSSGDDLAEISKILQDAVTVADSPLVGCRWEIESAEDYWTDDPDEIPNLADKEIIEGILREREIIQLVGAAKSQKTWFALHLACSVAEGTPFLERPSEKKRVLYVDYELKKSTLKKRFSMVCKSRPDNLDLLSLRGEGSPPAIRDIERMVKAKGYGLVVIDSLYQTGWLSEENSNDSAPKELKPLQEMTGKTGASLLVVDHTAKGGGKDRSAVDSSRGASSKGGFFDGIFVLRPQEKSPEGESRVILDPALRDFPAISPLPVIGYTFTQYSCDLQLVGEADKSDLSGNKQAIWEALVSFEDGASAAEIGMMAKLSENTARRILNELKFEEKASTKRDPSHSQRILYYAPQKTETLPNP